MGRRSLAGSYVAAALGGRDGVGIEPIVKRLGPEANQAPYLQVGDAPVGHKLPDVAGGGTEILGRLVYV
jgi:hypothetical protein